MVVPLVGQKPTENEPSRLVRERQYQGRASVSLQWRRADTAAPSSLKTMWVLWLAEQGHQTSLLWMSWQRLHVEKRGCWRLDCPLLPRTATEIQLPFLAQTSIVDVFSSFLWLESPRFSCVCNNAGLSSGFHSLSLSDGPSRI